MSQIPLVENFEPIMLRKLLWGLKSLFTENCGRMKRGHEDTSGRSDAGVFEVRNLIVWLQFQLEVDEVTRRRLKAACLVFLLLLLAGGQKIISQK